MTEEKRLKEALDSRRDAFAAYQNALYGTERPTLESVAEARRRWHDAEDAFDHIAASMERVA